MYTRISEHSIECLIRRSKSDTREVNMRTVDQISQEEIENERQKIAAEQRILDRAIQIQEDYGYELSKCLEIAGAQWKYTQYKTSWCAV